MLVTLLNLKKRLGNITQKKYINSLSINDFEKAFNKLGYEIENISKFSNLKGLKFGKILKVEKNPNSDHLLVCQVQIANNQILTIQTAAKNPVAGKMVILFPVGSSKDGMVFEEKELKGIISQGMFAGLGELGYNEELLGIKDDIFLFSLNENQKEEWFYTIDPIDYFELDDYILDLSIPANRNDANSYYVLTLELAAYFNVDFNWKYSIDKTNKKFNSKISIETNDDVNHLSVLEAKNTNINRNLYSSSVDCLLLAKHGVKVQNDFGTNLSNLCLIMTGVPIFSYDADLLKDSIKIKRYSGKLLLENKKEVEVKDALTILNKNNEPLTLAHICPVNKNLDRKKTNNLVFEISSYNPDQVRQTSSQVNVVNTASLQGSRKINKYMLNIALLYLKNKLAEYKLKISNVLPNFKPKKGKIISQNKSKLKTYYGLGTKNNYFSTMREIEEKKLKKIGFFINKNRFVAPPYRNDIEIYEDIIEEYFRFYNYDNFKPIPTLIKPYKISTRDMRKHMLAAQGYNEIKSYTLTSIEKNDLNPFNFSESINLMTFVSNERSVIRNSIITSMMEIVKNNVKQKIESISIFEEGMINNNIFVYGIISNQKSFAQVKNDLFNLIKDKNVNFIEFQNNNEIHTNVSAKIMLNGQMIGWIGKLHPKYELNEFIVAEVKKLPIKNTQVSKFNVYDNSPLKSIDLTFALNLKESIQIKINEIKNIINPFEIKCIDSFKKENKNHITIRVISNSSDIKLLNDKYNN